MTREKSCFIRWPELVQLGRHHQPQLTDSHGDLPSDSRGEDVLLDHDVQDSAVEDRVDPVAQERDEREDRILEGKMNKKNIEKTFGKCFVLDTNIFSRANLI